MARPMIKEAGMASLLLENPYYIPLLFVYVYLNSEKANQGHVCALFFNACWLSLFSLMDFFYMAIANPRTSGESHTFSLL